MSNKVWINKKELRERFGDVSDTVIKHLIDERDFPKPIALDNSTNKKWHIPSVEEWERKEIAKSIKPKKGSDLMKNVATPDIVTRDSLR